MKLFGVLRNLIPNLFRWGLISRWLIALCLWAISMQLFYPVLSPWPIVGITNTIVMSLCFIVLLVRLAARFSPGKPIWIIAKPFLHLADAIALTYIVCGVGVYLNGALEGASAQTQYAEVLEVTEEPLRVGRWWPAGRVKLRFQDADSSPRYLVVNATVLERVLPGAVMRMWVYGGGLGLPWVESRSLASDSTATIAHLLSKGVDDSLLKKLNIRNDLRENHLKHAMEQSRQYFTQEPTDFYFAGEMALSAFRAGYPVQAVHIMEPFVEKYRSYKLYCLFASYLGKNGDTLKSIEYLKAAVGIDPDATEAYEMLGYAYKNQGDKEESKRAFTKLVQLEPGYAYVLKGL